MTRKYLVPAHERKRSRISRSLDESRRISARYSFGRSPVTSREIV